MSAPTVYDVAERSGVSIATVSRVYRNPDSVRVQTREKVMEAARELGYVPSGSARGLASRTTGVLGLCFPDFADQDAETAAAASDADDDQAVMLYSDQIIRGMERAARRHGYALLIAASLEGGPESLVAKVAGRVDGFAVLARTVPTEDLEVISRRLPVVMLAGPREIDHLDHIVVANAEGERELTRHLIEDHGLRRLAFIGGGEDSPDSQARFRGFQEACRDAGLPVPSRPELRAGMMTQAEGALAADTLLDRSEGTGVERPEAMLFANDQMAVGALQALERRGVRVPEDIAVTGFDGIPLSRIVRPPLTTVRQPIRLLGEQAVELLVQRLADPGRAPVSLELPVSVTRRASCGCG
ncbi:LacI family DNA-binding transcriptional regulator [Streptomyces fimicarius]|uniref:LacI family DNA-binding transcriptional regulator n=3 Tax=Streptomyces TaxID=1883 RepID=A0AB33KB96_9ACTN|nr:MULTISPECIES: LacI family DNA-binding transcriptional regulator [Streptomyces]MCL6287662.1 LacI family transcriptional regulator [Streptomyces sp. 43Y-GA-1]MCX4711421.1 LacI family transcriptional regulator [Streptomyces griseus]MDX2673221.1 LacI family DNA-binding transcriptional regulator [Streptomyces sp. NRRL_ISP-5395]MDX3338650.1 LacI family DNA-binding transcriptional regulator [Streptomyces sp. ME02-6979.5a]MDX3504479.1 LacI family DNA-binding transcriptional regulator [Streptomyces 